MEFKLETILNKLTGKIIESTSIGEFEDANFFLEQYIKLSSNSIARYSLESMIRVSEGEIESAKSILEEGIRYHPLSFDLLYNLGYVFEKKENFFEAYHLYMKARYIAASDEEKKDLRESFERLKKIFKAELKITEDEIVTSVIAGDIKLNQRYRIEDVLNKKSTLQLIENNIDKAASLVLEINFKDGIISKNLNYYGYDVTAVSPNKEDMLSVIIKEWHDNLLQPDQKVAKFYNEEVDLEWMRKIPIFDIIIAISDNNFATFNTNKEASKEMLELLIKKSRKQLFIRVSTLSSDKEFSKEDLIELVARDNLKLSILSREEDGELCVVTKGYIDPFIIPKALETRKSDSIVLEVELNKCKDVYASGYINDFNPFVELIKQYEENPMLRYEDSMLKKYYDNFTPRNLEEHLFCSSEKAPELRRGWIGYPWVWDRKQKVIFQKKINDTRPGGIHYFGPNTDEFGKNEFHRLINLYSYLKTHGYHPELFADGYISGYLLIKDKDYRFVVTEGQHRIACLAALNYEMIRCRFTQAPGYPRVVDLKDINKWGQVENKTYSKNLARKVFNRFFDEGVGMDRMEIWSQK